MKIIGTKLPFHPFLLSFLCRRMHLLVCYNKHTLASDSCFALIPRLCSFSIVLFILTGGFRPSLNVGVFLPNPCNPAVRQCYRHCSHGYAEGANGCLYCSCRSDTLSDKSTVTPHPVGNTEMLQHHLL